MRHFNSEHIAMVASFLYKPGANIQATVQLAIELQQESVKQCEANNKELEQEERRMEAQQEALERS